MFLYESQEVNTYTGARGRNAKITTYTRTKTVQHFKCNKCDIEFTRPKNGKLPQKTDSHYCDKCKSYSMSASLASASKHKRYAEVGYKFSNGKNGYKEIFVGDNYPYRPGVKWIREHIAVMEHHIGSKIPTGMVVHHIDGDKQNNDISNLFLCTVSEHNNLHGKIETLVFELVKRGLVTFNKDTHTYQFNPY